MLTFAAAAKNRNFVFRAFSAASKPMTKVAPEHEKFKPIICVSEYGDLLNVKPLSKLQKADSSSS